MRGGKLAVSALTAIALGAKHSVAFVPNSFRWEKRGSNNNNHNGALFVSSDKIIDSPKNNNYDDDDPVRKAFEACGFSPDRYENFKKHDMFGDLQSKPPSPSNGNKQTYSKSPQPMLENANSRKNEYKKSDNFFPYPNATSGRITSDNYKMNYDTETLQVDFDTFPAMSDEDRMMWIRDLYKEWCECFGKTYSEKRFKIFAENYHEFAAYAIKANEMLKLNKYADMTDEEYNRLVKKTNTSPVISSTADQFQSLTPSLNQTIYLDAPDYQGSQSRTRDTPSWSTPKTKSQQEPILEHIRSTYKEWCEYYGREYDEDRLPIFQKNVLDIERRVKEDGELIDLNEFADRTPDEMRAINPDFRNDSLQAGTVVSKEDAARMRAEFDATNYKKQRTSRPGVESILSESAHQRSSSFPATAQLGDKRKQGTRPLTEAARKLVSEMEETRLITERGAKPRPLLQEGFQREPTHIGITRDEQRGLKQANRNGETRKLISDQDRPNQILSRNRPLVSPIDESRIRTEEEVRKKLTEEAGSTKQGFLDRNTWSSKSKEEELREFEEAALAEAMRLKKENNRNNWMRSSKSKEEELREFEEAALAEAMRLKNENNRNNMMGPGKSKEEELREFEEAALAEAMRLKNENNRKSRMGSGKSKEELLREFEQVALEEALRLKNEKDRNNRMNSGGAGIDTGFRDSRIPMNASTANRMGLMNEDNEEKTKQFGSTRSIVDKEAPIFPGGMAKFEAKNPPIFASNTDNSTGARIPGSSNTAEFNRGNFSPPAAGKPMPAMSAPGGMSNGSKFSSPVTGGPFKSKSMAGGFSGENPFSRSTNGSPVPAKSTPGEVSGENKFSPPGTGGPFSAKSAPGGFSTGSPFSSLSGGTVPAKSTPGGFSNGSSSFPSASGGPFAANSVTDRKSDGNSFLGGGSGGGNMPFGTNSAKGGMSGENPFSRSTQGSPMSAQSSPGGFSGGNKFSPPGAGGPFATKSAPGGMSGENPFSRSTTTGGPMSAKSSPGGGAGGPFATKSAPGGMSGENPFSKSSTGSPMSAKSFPGGISGGNSFTPPGAGGPFATKSAPGGMSGENPFSKPTMGSPMSAKSSPGGISGGNNFSPPGTGGPFATKPAAGGNPGENPFSRSAAGSPLPTKSSPGGFSGGNNFSPTNGGGPFPTKPAPGGASSGNPFATPPGNAGPSGFNPSPRNFNQETAGDNSKAFNTPSSTPMLGDMQGNNFGGGQEKSPPPKFFEELIGTKDTVGNISDGSASAEEHMSGLSTSPKPNQKRTMSLQNLFPKENPAEQKGKASVMPMSQQNPSKGHMENPGGKTATGIQEMRDWEQMDSGAVLGYVYNSESFPDGTRIMTTACNKKARPGFLIKTESGSRYLLK